MSSDAIRYLDKQLGNFIHVIEDLASIELVPYGNTIKEGDLYLCPLGSFQCTSNKYQALVINKYITNAKADSLISSSFKVYQFIKCMAQSTSGNELTTLETCSTKVLENEDYATFMKAINSNLTEVVTLFESMREKTEKAIGAGNQLPRMPIVTVNGNLSFNALNDLVAEACDQQWIVSILQFLSKLVIFHLIIRNPKRAFALKPTSKFSMKHQITHQDPSS